MIFQSVIIGQFSSQYRLLGESASVIFHNRHDGLLCIKCNSDLLKFSRMLDV